MVIWVIKTFFVQFCVFLASLISSASVRFLLFLSFFVSIFAWNVPYYLIFLKRSLVFPILLFSLSHRIVHLKRLSYLSLLFSETLQSVRYLPFSFAFCFSFFSAIYKASSENHFAFLHFFFFGMVLVTTSCTVYEHPSIVLEALCLSDLIPWLCLSLPLYNRKGFD